MRITEGQLRQIIREELIRESQILLEMDDSDDTILNTPSFGRYDFIGRAPKMTATSPSTQVYDNGGRPYNIDLRPKVSPAKPADVRGVTPEGYSLTGSGAKPNSLITHIVRTLKELSVADPNDMSNPRADDVYSLLSSRGVVSRHIKDGASGAYRTADPDFQEAMQSWKEYFLTDPNNADNAAHRAIYEALLRLVNTGAVTMIEGSSDWRDNRFHSAPPKQLSRAEMEDNVRKNLAGLAAARKNIK